MLESVVVEVLALVVNRLSHHLFLCFEFRHFRAAFVKQFLAQVAIITPRA